MAPRTQSDEYYVISLFNDVLGETAAQGQTFSWLKGDTGVSLRVDAYYPQKDLIVEYHEKQHTQPVAIMDKAMTASGIPRREQRARYEQFRRDGAKANGINLLEIHYHELDAKPNGKLRRSIAADLKIVRAKCRAAGIIEGVSVPS